MQPPHPSRDTRPSPDFPSFSTHLTFLKLTRSSASRHHFASAKFPTIILSQTHWLSYLILNYPLSMATASASPPANNTRDGCFPAQKRPAATLDDNASDRANNKRRASRACLSCRNRKVRCDVTKSDVPCTNCRLDRVECVVTESNRGRRPNAAGSSSADAAASTTITVSAPGPPAHPVSASPRSRSSSRHQPSPRLPFSDEPGPEPPTAAVLSPATTAADYMLSLSFEGWLINTQPSPMSHCLQNSADQFVKADPKTSQSNVLTMIVLAINRSCISRHNQSWAWIHLLSRHHLVRPTARPLEIVRFVGRPSYGHSHLT